MTKSVTMMAHEYGWISVVRSKIKSSKATKVGCTKVSLRRTIHSVSLMLVLVVHDEGPYERKTQFANDIADWILARAN